MRLNRVLIVLVGVVASLIGFSIGTTTAGAISIGYAGSSPKRVEVRMFAAREVGFSQVAAHWERSASSSIDGPRTSSTPGARSVAAKEVNGFGGLSQADDFGVWSYRTLKSDLAGTGLQAHHLIEQRFARVMGQAAEDIASIAVDEG